MSLSCQLSVESIVTRAQAKFLLLVLLSVIVSVIAIPVTVNMMTSNIQLTPDEAEEKVLSELPRLSAAALEAACGVVKVQVEETLRGNRKKLRKLLTDHLDAKADADDMTDYLQLVDHLFPPAKSEEEAVFENDSTAKGIKKEVDQKSITEKVDRILANASSKSQEKKGGRRRSSSLGHVDTITRVPVRSKEFKLPGMIGGTGETALSYSSLVFEVEKGRRLGYRETEMCAAVISKVADKELRSLFQDEPGIKLEDVMDMLKSTCVEQENTAKNVFTKLSTDKQGENEKTLTFITRVLRRRKKVLKLAEEEGILYDEKMLATTAFQVIFGGLRDENIRTALREKCRGDQSIEDKVLMKHAAEVIATEQARKQLLFGKDLETETVQVNALSSKQVKFEETPKKEKLNPFVKIEELRAEMRAELSEIKSLVKANNTRRTDDEEKPADPKPKKTKCDACHKANKWRCYHCWNCGKSGHKTPECPEEN